MSNLDDHDTDSPQPARPELAPAHHPDQNAMQDESIAQRLEDDPTDVEAQLDAGLDQSMDASDPPASVQPGDTGEPMPSSGYDAEAEEALRTE